MAKALGEPVAQSGSATVGKPMQAIPRNVRTKMSALDEQGGRAPVGVVAEQREIAEIERAGHRDDIGKLNGGLEGHEVAYPDIAVVFDNAGEGPRRCRRRSGRSCR